MHKSILLSFTLWLSTAVLANTQSVSLFYSSKAYFNADQSSVSVTSNTVVINNKTVSCYEFYVNYNRYRYVPAGKKRQGYLEMTSDGYRLMNFDQQSMCGLSPDGVDTFVFITNNKMNIVGVPYSYSEKAIFESDYNGDYVQVGKTEHDFDLFLLASLITMKSTGLYNSIKSNYTNGIELTEYIKDQRNRDTAAYLGNRNFFQNKFEPYYQSLSKEEQDILVGNGYGPGGYARYKINFERLRSDLDQVLDYYNLVGNPNYYISTFSLRDMELFQNFLTTRKNIEKDIAAFNRHVEEIKEQRKVNDKAKIRAQWLLENKFSHEVSINYMVKSWECSLCHSNCYSHGSATYSLLTESDLTDSEFYNELYRGLQGRTNLALNILYKGCSHGICTESVTGKTQHQWKEINSETKSEILKLENL
ncbi:MAG: hypothetical protein O3C22_08245 [Bacteroidetes bacterium]|nr:hypothetical protein [Bacteroidota bacterium]